MSEITMTLESGKTRVLHIAGKYCDKDIMVTATGGDYEKGYQDGNAAGIEEGKQAEYDAFWDAYQDNGNRADCAYAFYNKGWNDITYNPKYNIVARMNARNVFGWNSITDTKVNIDISNAINIGAFFGYCKNLKTIRNLVVSETVPFETESFAQCYALEDITIEGIIGTSISFKDSALLTTASVNSVINALKDLTGASSQTITFHADVGGKLTDGQKTTITAKNWQIVY